MQNFGQSSENPCKSSPFTEIKEFARGHSVTNSGVRIWGQTLYRPLRITSYTSCRVTWRPCTARFPAKSRRTQFYILNFDHQAFPASHILLHPPYKCQRSKVRFISLLLLHLVIFSALTSLLVNHSLNASYFSSLEFVLDSNPNNCHYNLVCQHSTWAWAPTLAQPLTSSLIGENHLASLGLHSFGHLFLHSFILGSRKSGNKTGKNTTSTPHPPPKLTF